MWTDAVVAVVFVLVALPALTWTVGYYVAKRIGVFGPPQMMEREETHRGLPEIDCDCSASCFADDWVCLCKCHDGKVPLHKIRDHRRALEALGRLTETDG